MHSGSISSSIFCPSFLKPKKIFEGALAIEAFLRRLQPLLEDMDRDLFEMPLALSRAMKEKSRWLAFDRSERLKTFEQLVLTLLYLLRCR